MALALPSLGLVLPVGSHISSLRLQFRFSASAIFLAPWAPMEFFCRLQRRGSHPRLSASPSHVSAGSTCTPFLPYRLFSALAVLFHPACTLRTRQAGKEIGL